MLSAERTYRKSFANQNAWLGRKEANEAIVKDPRVLFVVAGQHTKKWIHIVRAPLTNLTFNPF